MKKDNKGFSLVELIIVIAIMAVLVGVLAPQFIKYVEQSRRSRDIQTAQEIREAVLAAIADGKISGQGSNTAFSSISASVDTITSTPVTAGNPAGVGTGYTVTYNGNTGVCEVYAGTAWILTTESGASSYKNAT